MNRTGKFLSIRTLAPLCLGIAAGAGLALAVLTAAPVQPKASPANGPAAVQTIKPLSAAPGIRLTRTRTADGGRCFTAQRNGFAETICTH